MINPSELMHWNQIWNESKKQILESTCERRGGYLTEAEAQNQAAVQKPIVIKSAGTKLIPQADFKMSSGSKLRMINPEINEKDGVLFSDDEDDYKAITRMTSGSVAGSVVEIAGKEYPVLAIQKMGEGSRWSFVLDYDEDKPSKPSKGKPKAQQEARGYPVYISNYPASYEEEDADGNEKTVEADVDVEVLVTGGNISDPRDPPDFEIDKILDHKTGKVLSPDSKEFQSIHDYLNNDDGFAQAVWDATK